MGKLKDDVANVLKEMGMVFTRRLNHCTDTMVKLMETGISIDLVNMGSDDVNEELMKNKNRIGLRRLIRKAERNAADPGTAAAAPQPAPGDKKSGKTAPATTTTAAKKMRSYEGKPAGSVLGGEQIDGITRPRC
uniref:Uncharacterized protein n=1 Tax=Spongospora subterranea TaxID=70186 RepID=A0A0H5RFI6_9EUKA|eukprot:CRZ12302.1 hypothetical protein [Spongospora subterranea]